MHDKWITSVAIKCKKTSNNTSKKYKEKGNSSPEKRGRIQRKMDNVDSYMNLIMTDAEELHESKVIANYGRVIVRGNNVLFIKLENEL